MRLLVPAGIESKIMRALQKAGGREIGGVLMGESLGKADFRLIEVTVQSPGRESSFVRDPRPACAALERFFEEKAYQYRRFNYLGEWHSHPSFSTEPSSKDRATMLGIVRDREVGADFAVLWIVRLTSEGIQGTATVFTPEAKAREIRWQRE